MKAHSAEYVKEWRKRNPELWKLQSKRHYQRRKEHIKARVKRYAKANASRVRELQRRCHANRRRRSLSHRIQYNLRNRIGWALKLSGSRKCEKTTSLLGCSIPDFRIYIESKFQPGMAWENYGKGKGKWNLDHIMPCSIFDLTKASHQKRCFHFSNYQPMWETENRKKSYHCPRPQLQLL